MGASVSCSCVVEIPSSLNTHGGGNGNQEDVQTEINHNCFKSRYYARRNLIFPNEILEKILSFLSVRDLLVSREVCRDWCSHLNTAGNLQELVKVKVCSDELSYLTATTPVFTSFYFHKLDITRQSVNFWNLYSDYITYLDFYDCSIIPRNTIDSKQPSFNLGCPNLKYLGLVNCDKYFLMGGTFIQLDEILCLENLETLNLSQNKNLSDSILFSILVKTKRLQQLDLRDCPNMVFMKAVHNRFYPAGKVRPPYSDHVLSFHTLCTDFLQTSKGYAMTRFDFGMKLNPTGVALLLKNGNARWECVNLESPELKVAGIVQFLQTFNETLTKIELGMTREVVNKFREPVSMYDIYFVENYCSIIGRAKLTSDNLFSANLCPLQDISIYDSRTITQLNFLATMPNLQRLILDGGSGFDLNSEYFQSVPNLRELSLNGVTPKDSPDVCRSELIKMFRILVKLTALDIGNCSQLVTDFVVQGIVQYLKKLKRLNLEASKISEIGLTAIRNSPSFEAHPKNCTITTTSTDQFCLSQLLDIEELNLSRCRDLNELTWLMRSELLNLTSLNLSNCNTLSKRGTLSIIDHCRSLETLTLMHCSTQVLADPEVITTAREKLYRCKGIIY